MAGQRGFVGRSRDDLYATAESVGEMLAQLKNMNAREGRMDGAMGGEPPYQNQWRHNNHMQQNMNAREGRMDGAMGGGAPYQNQWRHNNHMQQEWVERPRTPERAWWRGGSRGRPGPNWHHRNYQSPDPSTQEMEHPWEPTRGPRGRQQNQGYHRNNPQYTPRSSTPVQQLMQIFTQSKSLSISLLNLMENHNLPPQQVRSIVTNNSYLFQLEEEVVTLAPDLKLCTAHSSSSGCQSRKVCDSLHICPKYVFGRCNKGESCVFGHRFHTDHNMTILKQLSMEYIKFNVLRDLLRRDHGQGQQGGHEARPLDVCKAYNGAGCDKVHCPDLHVCLSFVVGLTTCTLDKCQLNHDLLSPACCHLLKQHHFSVNETPRDVAMALLQANPSIKNKASAGLPAKPSPAAQGRTKKGSKGKNAADLPRQPSTRKNQGLVRKESEESSSSASETESETDDSEGKGKKSRGAKESRASKAKAQGRGKHGRGNKAGNTSATETDSEEDADDRPDKGKERDNTGKGLPKQQQKDNASQRPRPQEPPKPAPRRTLWAHYLYGDVTVPQICYYSVETMCRDEENVCPKLHAITHFHWQVKDHTCRWFNLRPNQVTAIEKAFCDPALDGVKLSRLDPSKLDPSVSGLFLLLGRDVWQVDFPTNGVYNSAKNKKLELRRLCTEPVAGKPIKASMYCWYFLDINNKWVKYGNVDTAGKQNLVSSITSADIENHYLKTPQQPLTFQNASFTFILDLISMKQTNQSTGTTREVRRRPEPHIEKKKDNVASDLPSHWDAMQPDERSKLVILAPGSDEYKKVVAILGTKVSPNNVVKVDRIQNPFMWCALQNKIKDMTALYKNTAMVNVQQLFHGTNPNVVDNICKENFDWRLHGSSTGQAYGRGTYFGTDAGISYGYCRTDAKGLKYMFVARVAIGSMTTGNSTMARPPINPATSMPYDSTVDNPTQPSMVIKYGKEEYYPEYLLTLS